MSSTQAKYKIVADGELLKNSDLLIITWAKDQAAFDALANKAAFVPLVEDVVYQILGPVFRAHDDNQKLSAAAFDIILADKSVAGYTNVAAIAAAQFITGVIAVIDDHIKAGVVEGGVLLTHLKQDAKAEVEVPKLKTFLQFKYGGSPPRQNPLQDALDKIAGAIYQKEHANVKDEVDARMPTTATAENKAQEVFTQLLKNFGDYVQLARSMDKNSPDFQIKVWQKMFPGTTIDHKVLDFYRALCEGPNENRTFVACSGLLEDVRKAVVEFNTISKPPLPYTCDLDGTVRECNEEYIKQTKEALAARIREIEQLQCKLEALEHGKKIMMRSMRNCGGALNAMDKECKRKTNKCSPVGAGRYSGVRSVGGSTKRSKKRKVKTDSSTLGAGDLTSSSSGYELPPPY